MRRLFKLFMVILSVCIITGCGSGESDFYAPYRGPKTFDQFRSHTSTNVNIIEVYTFDTEGYPGLE